jgi:hypothetical protein
MDYHEIIFSEIGYLKKKKLIKSSEYLLEFQLIHNRCGGFIDRAFFLVPLHINYENVYNFYLLWFEI